MSTKPEVFIIESLNPGDEGNGRFEGVLLSQILRLHKKEPKYRYVRTRKQFSKAIKEFGKSNYRYLHISAHGNRDGLCTTNLDDIDYSELADLLAAHMDNRRLFISSCKMVHKSMAAAIIVKSGCLSVIGPTKKIKFSESALVWASVYHLMFSTNQAAMSQAVLLEKLRKVRALFKVPLAFFSTAKNNRGYTSDLLGDDL